MTPDGARIVTGSFNRTAFIWDATSRAEVAVLKGHRNVVWSVAVTPDGARIVTGSEDETARIWDFFWTTQALVNHAKAIVPRCLTPIQREQFYLAPEPPRWCLTMKKWPYHDATPASQ